jgi:hypothetical protein
MGCDIHCYLERYRSINDEKKWVNIDNWKLNPYYDGIDKYEDKYQHKQFYRGQDYELFDILAGVRTNFENGLICKPKGLPEDCSEVVKEQSEIWNSDGHNHSYFTLKELRDWLRMYPTIKRSGMISQEAAKLLDLNVETPNFWTGWAHEMLDFVYREWEDISPLKYFVDKMENFLSDEWRVTKNEENLQQFENDMRVIFWFDN